MTGRSDQQRIGEKSDSGFRNRNGEQVPSRVQASTRSSDSPTTGLRIERYFTTANVDPFDEIEWELARSALIANEKGEMPSSSRTTSRFPSSWSPTGDERCRSRNIFRGHVRDPRARDQCSTVDRARRRVGSDHGVKRAATSPSSEEDAQAYADELTLSARCTRRWPSIARSGSTSVSRDTPSAGERLFHQLCRRHDGVDHGSRKDRGAALQGRLGRRVAIFRRSSFLPGVARRAAVLLRDRSPSCAASTPSRE